MSVVGQDLPRFRVGDWIVGRDGRPRLVVDYLLMVDGARLHSVDPAMIVVACPTETFGVFEHHAFCPGYRLARKEEIPR